MKAHTARVLKAREKREAANKIMRANVHVEMNARMDTSVRLNASLHGRSAKAAALQKITNKESDAYLFGDEPWPSPAKGQKADATKGAGDVAAPKKLKLSGDAQGAPAKATSKLSASALKKLKLAEEKKRQKALEEEQAEVDAAEAAMAHVTEPESSDEEVDGRQEKGSLVVGAVVRVGEGKKKVEGVIRPVEADSEGRASCCAPHPKEGPTLPLSSTTTTVRDGACEIGLVKSAGTFDL